MGEFKIKICVSFLILKLYDWNIHLGINRQKKYLASKRKEVLWDDVDFFGCYLISLLGVKLK